MLVIASLALPFDPFRMSSPRVCSLLLGPAAKPLLPFSSSLSFPLFYLTGAPFLLLSVLCRLALGFLSFFLSRFMNLLDDEIAKSSQSGPVPH